MLANILTVMRVLLVAPVLLLALFGSGSALWIACGLYILAAVTDFFDGWIARKYNQISTFGAVLDPIADKLLVGGLLVVLAASGTVKDLHVIAVLLILLRELSVSGMREYLAPHGFSLPVTKLAKWKTATQMVALAVLVVTPALPPALIATEIAGLALLWISAALTVWTGAGYITRGLAFAREMDAKNL